MGVSSTYREIPVTFEKGMATQYEESLLPEASAKLLENWVPEETGGLRVREGWRKGTRTGGPTTAKGLGLSAFSVTHKPSYRQRSMISGSTASNPSGTTTRSFTYDWPSATLAGSLLILKVTVAYESVASTYHFIQDLGGYQLFWVSRVAASTGGDTVFWLLKENAASQTSATFKVTAVNTTSEMVYAIEGVELLNITTGTPKNLLPAGAANPVWFRSDGIASPSDHLNALGWFNETGLQFFRFPGTGPPWENTQSGTPTVGSNPGLPVGAVASIAISTLAKFGTASGTAGVPVTPNTAYVASCWAKWNTQINLRLNLVWYDSVGSVISTVNGATTAGNDALQRKQATGTSPSNAAFAKMQFENTNTSAASENVFISGAQFELGTAATNWAIGGVSSHDGFTNDADSTSPTSPALVSSVTPSVSLSWVEASIVGLTSQPVFTWSSFTKANEVSKDVVQDFTLSSAYKLLVGNTPYSDSVAFTTTPSEWAAFAVNFKVSASAIGSDIFYIAAQDNTTDFGVHYINQTAIDAGSWASAGTVTVDTGGQPVAFATGLGKLLFTHRGLVNVRRWDGVNEPIVAISPAFAGTSIAFFKSRFVVAGSDSTPTRLQYSDIGSVTSWPGTNFLEVGQDDGYTILDMAVQENSLIIGKGNSIYSLSGSGPDTFFLYRFPTGDAAPGRSVCITPSGTLVAGLTAVWQLTGTAIETVSKNLGASYKPSSFVHTAYNDGKAYILDVGAKQTFVYSLDTQAWHAEKFTSTPNQFNALISTGAGRLLASPAASTDTGLVMYRDLPSLSRTRDFSPLEATTKLTTPMMWIVGPRSKATVRHLFLQIRQRGDSTGDLVLKTFYDNQSGIEKTLENKGSGARRYRIDLGTVRDVSGVKFEITGPPGGNQFDIEDAVLGFDELEVR